MDDDEYSGMLTAEILEKLAKGSMGLLDLKEVSSDFCLPWVSFHRFAMHGLTGNMLVA
jgi:hypothetical protein